MYAHAPPSPCQKGILAVKYIHPDNTEHTQYTGVFCGEYFVRRSGGFEKSRFVNVDLHVAFLGSDKKKASECTLVSRICKPLHEYILLITCKIV